MVKYLILGDGWIGNRFNQMVKPSYLDTSYIAETQDVIKSIEAFNPEFVINCIGATGKPNIEWCEDHKAETYYSNTLVPMEILEACNTMDIKMVHISTGDLYEGRPEVIYDSLTGGWTEEDPINFDGSVYVRSKAAAETILKDFPVLQLRFKLPFDDVPHDKNLLTKLLKYPKILNVENSITYLPDAIRIAKTLMDNNKTGIYNVVCKNPISYVDILLIHKKITKKEFKKEFIDPELLDKNSKCKRCNNVLSVEKLEKEKIYVRTARDCVTECIRKYEK